MSTSIMARCWPLQLPPTAKSVLISLADNANDHGECWPSIATICERTCLGKTAVIGALKWLEERALLQVNRSSNRSNVYQLTLENYVPTSPSGEPSVSRTVREADSDSPPDEPPVSASRTLVVREADTNRKEPSVNRKEPSDKRKAQRTQDLAQVAELVSAGVDEQVAVDWLAIRKSKRLPLTKTALQGVMREANLAKIPLGDALKLCCLRGWGGFEAAWITGRSHAGGAQGGREQSRAAAAASIGLGGGHGEPYTIDQ